MSIARHVSGAHLDMAYEYLDWWLSGWAGATMARQGYYISAPDAIRAYLTLAEWAYWYDGKEAATDLVGVDGETLVVPKGENDPAAAMWSARAASRCGIRRWTSTTTPPGSGRALWPT